MTAQFGYDVFLSHNSADKPQVRRLAERLKAAGLRVWFDEWSIAPGEDIYLAIERGLETSRTLVLFLSSASLGSDWVSLERSTALFRDPTNSERRFLPVLLKDCSLPDTLRRYRYIDLRSDSEEAFAQLLAACQGAELPPVKTRRSRRSLPFSLLSLGSFLAVLLLLWLFWGDKAVLGRFQVVPPAEVFSVTAFVQGEDGGQDLRGKGSVVLDLGQDRRRASIGELGQANFMEIPGKFRGQAVSVWVDAEGFELVKPGPRHLIGSELYLTVKRQDFVLRGTVRNSDNRRIAGATLKLRDLKATSDSDGTFKLRIPGYLLDQSLVLSVSAPGYELWEMDVVPGSNDVVAVLERSAR